MMDPAVIGKPTSVFNPELVGELLNVMKSIVHNGMTMIIVTYEMGFVREMLNCVIFFDQT